MRKSIGLWALCASFLVPTATSATPLPEEILRVEPSIIIPDAGTVALHVEERRSGVSAGLFINTGYGRDTASLLLMLVPRVIINPEEEFLQTGVDGFGLYSNR